MTKYSTTDMLDAIIRATGRTTGQGCSVAEYTRSKRPEDPSAITIIKRFDTWNRAVVHAGLLPNERKRGRPATISKEECIDAMQKVAAMPGFSPLSYRLYFDMAQHTGYPSGQTVRNKFGGWKNAKAAAGLD